MSQIIELGRTKMKAGEMLETCPNCIQECKKNGHDWHEVMKDFPLYSVSIKEQFVRFDGRTVWGYDTIFYCPRCRQYLKLLDLAKAYTDIGREAQREQ